MNEYQIIEKMATGGFSTVFKVCCVLDDGIFVMKRIPLSDFDEHQRRSAAQEIRVMSSLHHPFIVEQCDAFLFNDTDLCIVMAYYDGGDLDTIITRQRERDEYLSFDSAMMWFVGMCFALHYLHSEGVVHRDLKTHNVFLDRRTGEVAIGDFGVAEFVDSESPLSSPASQQLFVRQRDAELLSTLENRNTNDNNNSNNNNNNDNNSRRSKSPSDKGGPGPFGAAVRGTPLYMSPEALEHGVCSPASDVWSLGCILYELLALSHPFESRDIAALVVRVTRGAREPLPAHYPADITTLIDAMLAHNPEDRPDCAQILRAPAVAVFVRKLLARRVPRDSPQSSAAERAWDAQLHALGLITGEGENNIRGHKDSQGNSQGKNKDSQEDDDDDNRDYDDSKDFSLRCGLQTAAPAVRAHLRVTEAPASLEHGASELRDEEHEHNKYHKDHKEHKEHREHDKGHEEHSVGPSQGIRRAAGDVEDMRHRPLDEVRAEVAQHRQIVQNEMRAQQHRRLAEAFECKFGNGAVRGPLNPFSVRPTERRQPRALASSDTTGPRSGWGEGNGQSAHSAGHLEVSLARRKTLRTAEALRVLGEDAFARVYEYYRRVESVDRDVRLVMELVPDRTRWFALPLVGEIVVIDKIIARASEERRNGENKKRENGAVV